MLKHTDTSRKKGSFWRRSVQLKSRRLGLREVLSLFFLDFFSTPDFRTHLRQKGSFRRRRFRQKRLLQAHSIQKHTDTSGKKGSFGCCSVQLKSRWLGLREVLSVFFLDFFSTADLRTHLWQKGSFGRRCFWQKMLLQACSVQKHMDTSGKKAPSGAVPFN